MENSVNFNLNNTSSNNEYYTPIQLRLPLDLETIISFDDPLYTFDEVMKGCNLGKYLKSDVKDPRGRIGFNWFLRLIGYYTKVPQKQIY